MDEVVVVDNLSVNDKFPNSREKIYFHFLYISTLPRTNQDGIICILIYIQTTF